MTVSELLLPVHVLKLLPLLVATPEDLQGPGEVHGGGEEDDSNLALAGSITLPIGC